MFVIMVVLVCDDREVGVIIVRVLVVVGVVGANSVGLTVWSREIKARTMCEEQFGETPAQTQTHTHTENTHTHIHTPLSHTDCYRAAEAIH